MEYSLNTEEAKAVQAKLEELEKAKDKKEDKLPHLSLQVKQALGLIGY